MGCDWRAPRATLALPLLLVMLATACMPMSKTARQPLAGTAPVTRPLPPATVPLTFALAPLDNPVVSSSYGQRKKRMHNGIDFAAPVGSDVLAVADGTVAFAGRMTGYGRLVELVHPDGTVTRYAHLGSFGEDVALGATIHAGAIVGTVGTSGRTTGPNLHFEVLVADRYVNPSDRLPLE